MKMYSGRDVRYIVQDFLANHFNFDFVSLSEESIEELENICGSYGIEVENIIEQYWLKQYF